MANDTCRIDIEYRAIVFRGLEERIWQTRIVMDMFGKLNTAVDCHPLAKATSTKSQNTYQYQKLQSANLDRANL